MSHLVAISIGPVQDFIAAARRTNDLYAGSRLLQDAVRASAQAILDAGGSVIFPSDANASGPNKILASLDGDPRRACADAEKAARKVLADRWANLVREYPSDLHKERGEQQVAHFLEFYAAWWPWDGEDASYADASRDVERLLAGRKALRDFSQPIKNLVPKSPLDPSRDSVLVYGPQGRLTQSPLWLKPNEHFDAVSLIKRAMSQELGSVPSVADVAARAFLQLRGDMRDWLANNGQPERAVFKSYWEELQAERSLDENRQAELSGLLKGSEPNPYFAILVADGDRMGHEIRKMKTMREHIEFSKNIGEFSSGVAAMIEPYLGHPVYAGGDDVLAFLPLHTCLDAACCLARSFHEKTGLDLTVGLAIVHFHEPLYLTLELARGAEHAAKANGRNRLRLEWHSRGGQTRVAEHSWSDGFDLAAWNDWRHAFSCGLTRGLAYELATLGRETARAGLDGAVVRAEADRVFARKEWDGKPERIDEFAPWVAARSQLQGGEDLVRLSELLVLMQGLDVRGSAVEEAE